MQRVAASLYFILFLEDAAGAEQERIKRGNNDCWHHWEKEEEEEEEKGARINITLF